MCGDLTKETKCSGWAAPMSEILAIGEIHEYDVYKCVL